MREVHADSRRLVGQAQGRRLPIHHALSQSRRGHGRPGAQLRDGGHSRLIEGAADGAGLGIRFLKHLQRTRILLHLVDIAPPDPAADPVKDARMIVAELKRFSADLAAKERWLLINKIDLLPPQEAERRAKDIVRRLRWKGKVLLISAPPARYRRAQTGRDALSGGAPAPSRCRGDREAESTEGRAPRKRPGRRRVSATTPAVLA